MSVRGVGRGTALGSTIVRLMRRGRASPSLNPGPGESQRPDQGAQQEGLDEVVRWSAEKTRATIVGFVLVAFGVVVLLVSLLGVPTLAEAGLSFSSGLMIAGVILVLERRLVRDIRKATGEAAATVAAKVTDERTAEIRERIEHLESLQEIQSKIATDRQTAVSRLMAKIREAPDFESTAELLEHAETGQLFRDIRLRSGSDRDFLMSFKWRAGFRPSPIEAMDPDWATLERMEFDLDEICLSATSAAGEESAVSYWSPGESVEEAWNNFLDACEREGVAPTRFELSVVFDELAASYGAMIEARRSPEDSPRRLHGRLRMLVNDQWAITDEGLESRRSSYISQSRPPGTAQCPAGHDEQLWQEALFYSRLLDDS